MSNSVVIHEHVRSMIDPDGAVLLDLKQGKYYSLNGLGADIWRKLEAGRSAEQIEEELAEMYDAPTEDLRRDVADFIADLQRKRLVDAGA